MLRLLVGDDAALREVDEEELAGLQPPLAHDVRRVLVEHAGLRREHDPAVGGLVPAAGTQAVAVERRADHAAVGERDRGGAVPRLHQALVERVEAAQLGRHVVAALVRLGDHHHQRVRQRPAGEHEQLEHVVEGRRVGAAGADHRQHLLQVVAEELRCELRLARAHPVAVAAQRVDLAVVRDHAVRMRELPARERVRRVAGVDERERARDPLVREVEIEALELRRRQHSLVDERPRREARHDEIGPGCELGDAADHVELPLEGVLVEAVGGADDRLPDARRDPGGDGPGLREVDRDVAPTEEPLPFVADRPLDERLELGPARLVEGEEERTDAVPAGGGRPSTDARKSASGSWIRIPAPSPESASAPEAPRCSRFESAARARRTVSWEACPSSRATNATPHASCS